MSVEPQPSVVVPQFQPCAAHVVGVQPQTLSGPPPPQLLGASQVPQLTVAPQPLDTAPQFLPSAAQVCGAQMPSPRSGSSPAR